MTIYADVQKLEPGAWVELFVLDASTITGNSADTVEFHGYTQLGNITFGGVAYEAWPITAEGFVIDPSRPARPTLTAGNINGAISALCARTGDCVGAKLTRRRTLGQYLDDQAEADPTQKFEDVWYIERKAQENGTAVQFELVSPLEVGNIQLPRRRIVANVCPWVYRSAECGYTGPPRADEFGNLTSDPAKDKCGKRLSDCRLRFGDGPLPYGGFPAAQLKK